MKFTLAFFMLGKTFPHFFGFVLSLWKNFPQFTLYHRFALFSFQGTIFWIWFVTTCTLSCAYLDWIFRSERIFSDVAVYSGTQDRRKIRYGRKDIQMVEMRRIELLTPCLQGRCSPSWATPPNFCWYFTVSVWCLLIWCSLDFLFACRICLIFRRLLVWTIAAYVGTQDCENWQDTENLVGLSGLEPPTSRLSGVRSNRLSYRPILS